VFKTKKIFKDHYKFGEVWRTDTLHPHIL